MSGDHNPDQEGQPEGCWGHVDQKQPHDIGGDPQVGIVHEGQQSGEPQEDVETHGQQAVNEHFVDQADVKTVGDNKRKQGKSSRRSE